MNSVSLHVKLPLRLTFLMFSLSLTSQNAEYLATHAPGLIQDQLMGQILIANINVTLMPRLKCEFSDPEPEDVANELRELGLQCIENLLRARQPTGLQSSHLSRLLGANFDRVGRSSTHFNIAFAHCMIQLLIQFYLFIYLFRLRQCLPTWLYTIPMLRRFQGEFS